MPPNRTVKRSKSMTSKVEQRLQEAGVAIPDAPSPAANYLPFTRTGNLIFVSGQVPFVDGKAASHWNGWQGCKRRRRARPGKNMCNQSVSPVKSRL